MEFMPKLQIGIFNAYLPIVFYMVFAVILSYILDKEGFKRGGDKSWIEKKDRLAVQISGYLFFLIILFSLWVPIKSDTKAFYAGLLLYIIAIILSVYTSISYVTAPKDKLITKGIYKFSRNPVYLGNTLVVLSAALLSGAWLYFAFLILYFIATHFTILAEEKYCMKKYVDEYQSYFDQTPRYFGFF